jgi:hypothetical protein
MTEQTTHPETDEAIFEDGSIDIIGSGRKQP